MTTTVGSRELKNRLGTYLRKVKAGQTVRITEHGRHIADIKPAEPASDELETKLQQAAEQGLIALPKSKTWKPFPRIRSTGPSIVQAIIEDREDRF